MQVSRAVVNGGLAELAKQGFLEVGPRQGTCVADYRRKGNLGTLIAIMEYQGGVLGKDEIRSILEVRRALEHLAAERAIRYASDEALSQLGEIVARLKDAANATLFQNSGLENELFPAQRQENPEFRKENELKPAENASNISDNQPIIIQKSISKSVTKIVVFYSDGTFDSFGIESNSILKR